MSSVVFEMSGSNYWYEQFLYPDGAMQVRIRPERVEAIRNAKKVIIVARIQNSPSIIEFLLLRDTLQHVRFGDSMVLDNTDWVIPFWPYARADRRFTDGDCFGLEVWNYLIGGAHCTTLDVHSVISQEIGVVNSVDPISYIQQAIFDFESGPNMTPGKINILFPDEGARKRYTIPAIVGTNTNAVACNILHCDKDRDPVTGKLRDFIIPAKKEFWEAPVLIVDDICDGGGTFVGIGKKLHENRICQGYRRGLYTTHGIYSKGFGELLTYFDHLYSTNSFLGASGSEKWHTTFNCIPDLINSVNASN